MDAVFFVPEVKQERRFTITDSLWPIDLNEMNTNGQRIQHPGWSFNFTNYEW